MRLKSLELAGFKSFPDRTLLDFNSGMTVVVGPNGSGKSNISDAIRWVLGELSAKSVRGTKMEDVIFGGSDGRKALPFAEVSLTIDNSEGVGSGRIDSDYDEVTVTRRCYRSGESEYQINRKPARLRDISELFLNTGIGKTGYSIIGQGRIAEIISQKSEDRRVIFEEAAGISKYRYKKTEAERKLAGVDENLIRLGDILSELSSRLGPLEKESEKARRYLEIFEKKKQTDVALWLFELDAIRGQADAAEAEYTAAKQLFDDADEALTSLENKNEKLFGAAQQSKLEAERVSERLKDYRDRLHSLESSRMVLENDISHLRSQISDAEADIKIRRTAAQSAKEHDETLRKEAQSVADEVAGLEEQRGSDGDELYSLREQRGALELEQDNLRKSNETANAAINELKVKSAAESSSRSNIDSRRSELKTAIKNAEKEKMLLDERIERADKSMRDYTDVANSIKAELAEADAAVSSDRASAENISNEINKLTLDRLSKKQRADTLRRMDELFEGYNQSVRAVMKAVENGSLTGIFGPVSKLIEVEPKHSVAIETAVGANIQNIVTSDENAAKAAIAYLKQNNAGRATFYPLTSISPSPLNISRQSLDAYRGYIGIASELVKRDERFANIVDYMLGRTVVFDNLDNATVMARATGYRVRIVTLDGQLINAGGSFTGGSVKRDTGMLTRSSEIARIENEIDRADIAIKGAEARLAEVKKRIADSDSALKDKNDRVAILARMYQAENTQLQVLRSQLSTDENSIKQLGAELEALENRSAGSENELEALAEQLKKQSGELEASVAAAEEIERQRQTLSKLIVKKTDAFNALCLTIAERKKDAEAAERSVRFSEDTLNAAAAQIEKLELSTLRWNEAIIDAQNKISSENADSVALENDIASLETRLSELNTASGKQDSELSTLRARIKEQTARRENLFREYNRLETKRASVAAEQDKLTSRLWDEYELTYSTAKELSYPPVTADNRRDTLSVQTELRSKLKALGNVNTSSIDEYKEVKERHDFLKSQTDDLVKSKDELAVIIDSLEREMRERFTETIDTLSISFDGVFRELFGGGSAELKLTQPDDVLNSGIEINVAPPGKIIKSLSLLSGGEQAFVAIALFFAILNINPTPFCVLDEIEAALDDVNVARFAEYARRYSDRTQFIIITHRRPTMERADTIYGVTMPTRGVSKVLTLDMSEIESKLGVKL